MTYFWGDIIVENIYGHAKKLAYIISEIENYRILNGVTNKDVHILDVGCGNGDAVTFQIAKAGYTITGIDMHVPSIDYAIKHNRFSNLSFYCQKVEDMSHDINNRFDIIVCADIIEHLIEPKVILEQLYGVLKDDGILIISIPNGYGPFEVEKGTENKAIK